MNCFFRKKKINCLILILGLILEVGIDLNVIENSMFMFLCVKVLNYE